MRLALAASLCLALPATAETHRQHDAHVHGHGALDIALEGDMLALSLRVPGMDIVGFEHAPGSAQDQAAIDAALARLSDPYALFALPEAAGCTPSEATADLADTHDDHDHQDAPRHTEFQADFLFTCTTPERLDVLGFPYFDLHPGAEALEVRIVSDKGTAGAEVGRATARLKLDDLF